MNLDPVQQLAEFGPERCRRLAPDEAVAWCRRLARGHAENFTVLSGLVPRDRRNAFAAVYAFCRWADDLGDEIGDPDRSLELLAWWRRELEQCFEGAPRHPVFVALAPVIERYTLPMGLFDDLIRAFEQDQHTRRYETWAQLLDYCTRSANPVGRLVLAVLGESREDEAMLAASDAICTALQLTNHWQDIARDILERDRIYVPSEFIDIDDFERRLRDGARQGHAVDRTFLPATRRVVRELVERTWPLYEQGEAIFDRLGPASRPVVWLLDTGGQRVLRLIELWNYETALHRPRIGRAHKLFLVARAFARRRRSRTT